MSPSNNDMILTSLEETITEYKKEREDSNILSSFIVALSSYTLYTFTTPKTIESLTTYMSKDVVTQDQMYSFIYSLSYRLDLNGFDFDREVKTYVAGMTACSSSKIIPEGLKNLLKIKKEQVDDRLVFLLVIIKLYSSTIIAILNRGV